MALESKSRIEAIVTAVNGKTGRTHIDLKSAAQHLCDSYAGAVGSDTIAEYDTNEDLAAVNTIKSVLNTANQKTGVNHTNVTDAIQTLCDGYSEQVPLYSFGAVSDIHIQYPTGYTDFQRALAYFDRQSLPLVMVCGDLTWAGTMVNADRYTSEWKGGMEDYKDIVGDRTNVYAIGGNHECYTATYDADAESWSSVDTGLDVDAFRENTGCEPFYTVSSQPDDAAGYNVYCATLPDTDVFIMLSVKKATAPNLFFTADDGEDEFTWLENTLEANKNKRCFVFFHEHDNLDKTADPFYSYPHGISEGTEQGKAFIDLMRGYSNVIWFHGHTHNTFEADHYSVGSKAARGYRTVNIPSLQGPRKFNEADGSFTGTTTSECYIVDVYANHIILRALNLDGAATDGTGTAVEMESYVLETSIPGGEVEEDVITSISAAFTQGDTVIYDTDALDTLKPMLTVTANYQSGATETVGDYALSGTLAVGTSTITVAYEGMTTTFAVLVTEVAAASYTNLVTASTDASGNVYNTTGYKEDYRLSSGGGESAYDGAIISGFIPIEDLSDVIRITGHDAASAMVSGYVRAILYNANSSFAKVGHYDLQSARTGVELSTNANGTHEIKLVMSDHTGVADASAATHFRVTLGVCSDPGTFIITRNEEIV